MRSPLSVGRRDASPGATALGELAEARSEDCSASRLCDIEGAAVPRSAVASQQTTSRTAYGQPVPAEIEGPVRAPPSDELLSSMLTHRHELLAVAHSVTGSTADAEDVLQEVWLRCRAARGRVDAPRAWLRVVTRNLALDHVRRRAGRRETGLADHETGLAAPESPAAAIETSAALVAAVGRLLTTLSPLERAVYFLHQSLDWDHGDVARLLGRSDAAVRQLHRRARQHVVADGARFPIAPGDAERAAERLTRVGRGADVGLLLDAVAPGVGRVRPGRRRVARRDVHDVAGLLLVSDGRVWLGHRRPELPWYRDVWDLIGTHRRPNEPAAACVARAARDKLGVSIVAPRPLGRMIGHDYHLAVYVAHTWQGEAHNRSPSVHDDLRLFTPAQAAQLSLADPEILRQVEHLAD